jgi:succinate dehydrogenase/fumarate reductase flavoprotein subunit
MPIAYTMPRSVFTEAELREYWETWNRLYVAKLMYNTAFGKQDYTRSPA